MLNVLDIQDQLKNFSEQQLIKEMQMPSGNAPQFLVLSEINRRKRMKDAQKANEAAQMKTVAQDLVTAAGVPQQGIMQMAQAMNPKSSNAQNAGLDAILQKQQQQQPQQGAPVPQMYGGGYVKRMQAGGRVVVNGRQYEEFGSGFLRDPETGQIFPREQIESGQREQAEAFGRQVQERFMGLDAFGGTGETQMPSARPSSPPAGASSLPAPMGSPTDEMRRQADILARGQEEARMGLEPFGGAGGVSSPSSIAIDFDATNTELGAAGPDGQMYNEKDARRIAIQEEMDKTKGDLEKLEEYRRSPDQPATGMFDLPEDPRRRGKRGGGANEEPIFPSTGMFDLPEEYRRGRQRGSGANEAITPDEVIIPDVSVQDQSAQDQAVQAQEEAEKIRADSLSLERQIEDATGESTDLESQILQMLKDREASQEKDKWLALATAGLEIMGGANIGKAGASALKQYTQGSRDFDKDKLSYLLAVNKIREAKKKKGMSIGDASDLYRALQGELTDVLESLRKAQMPDPLAGPPNPEVINSLKARAAMLQSQINRYGPMLGLGSSPSTFDARVGG